MIETCGIYGNLIKKAKIPIRVIGKRKKKKRLLSINVIALQLSHVS